MKKLILLLFLGMCALGLFAQTTSKPTIVVVPFDVKGVPEEEADVLFEVFQSEFANTGKAKIVDRSSLEKIKTQQDFQNSDWSNTDKVAEMGKALNASMVVTGQIMMFKSTLVTTIKLIDVNTTEIVSSVVERTSNTDILFDRIPSMAQKLAERIDSENVKKNIEKTYKVGDEGPGKGIVFYVSEKGFNVYDGKGGISICHYLEMSKNTLGVAKWFPSMLYISTQTQTELGYGKSNTYKIVNTKSKTKTVSNCAAYMCYIYKTSTTNAGDWFLPSKDELDILYKNMKDRVLADSTVRVLWSSSSSSSDYAWYQNFSDGRQNSNYDGLTNKNTYSVRAIRAF